MWSFFSSKDQVSGCGYCIILDNGHNTVTSPRDISRSFCGIAIFKTHKPSRCNILWKPPLLWLKKKPPRDEFKITTVLVKNGIILKAGLSSGYLVCLFGEKKVAAKSRWSGIMWGKSAATTTGAAILFCCNSAKQGYRFLWLYVVSLRWNC